MTGPRIPAPTKEETEKFCRWLKMGFYQGTIGVRLGWTRTRLDAIIRYGRAGVDGFREFMEAVDDVEHYAAEDLLEKINEKIVKEHNLTAMCWMWDKRFGWREKALKEHQMKAEIADMDGIGAMNSLPSEDEIAAAEARALASLNETGEMGEKH